MNTTLSDISSNFEFDEQQTINHTNFIATFAIAQDMYQNDKYTEGLSEVQITSLEGVLNAEGPQVSQMALAILIRDNLDYEYTELVLEPSENSARKASNRDKPVAELAEVKLYPNPATDYFTLEYQVDVNVFSVLSIEIYDARGRKIRSQNLNLSATAVLIDVSTLSKGVYNVSFIADGKVLSVEKLTIIK